VKYAAKLDYPMDMSHLVSTTLTPHQKYGKVQRYGRGLPGDHVEQTKIGWASETQHVSNEARFIEQLPRKLLSLETPYVFLLSLPAADVAEPVLPAHRDFNKTCGINVYLEANGELTKFYHWDREKREAEFVEEFCSATGEIWLMDTDVPHSVVLVRNKTRRLLTFSFIKLTYNEVLECFATR
jgi:hypothetical protein